MRTTCLTTFILILILICAGHTTAQTVEIDAQYSYKRYTLYDGLPDMKVRGLIQDANGFIWLGLKDGFARFDGFEFTMFTPQEQTTTFGMKLDKRGNVLVKSSRFNHQLNTVNQSVISQKMADTLYYNGNNSRLLPYPYSIFENMQGNKKYLVRENKSGFSVLETPEILHQIGNGKLYFDTLNHWMLIPGDEVYFYHFSKKILQKIDQLSAETFLRVGNDMFAFGQTGIYRINMSDFSVNKLIDYSFDYNLIALSQPDGTILISDFGHIYRLRGEKLEVVASLSMIRDILIDSENNLWAATYAGLYNFFHLDFVNYTLPQQDVVMAMAEDVSGLYWTTLNGQLIQKQKDTYQKIKFPTFGYSLFSFSQGAAADSQQCYFPFPAGLMIKNKSSFQLADIPQGSVKRVHFKKNGNLVFSIADVGVCETTPDGKMVAFYSTDTLNQNVPDAVVDRHDRTIVIGSKGVNIIDTDGIRFVANLQGAMPAAACCDLQGNIWIGSESYLNIFAGNTLRNIYQFKGNSIKDILLTQSGWMVIATKTGIALFHPQQYEKSKKFEYIWYDYQNGITALDPHTFGLYEQNDGTIWLMSSEAAISFRIDQLIEKVPTPRLHILSIESSSDNVHWHNHDIDKRIVLSYPNRSIRLKYIGISYSAAQNVRYFIRMKGVQDEWVPYDKNREAIFHNLKPGTYLFELYADAGTEASRTGITTLTIIVEPAFWETWWFTALIITLTLAAIGGGTYWGISRFYKKKNRQLTTELQLNDLKIKSIRLKSIPHFNANVLAAIEYYVMNMSKEEANKLLNLYAQFTNRTLREVEKAARSLRDEIEYVTLYLQLEKLRFREKFDFEVSIDNQVSQDILIPNMVLQTYCENAVKHGFAGMKKDFKISITASMKDDYLLVSVQDNGIGREAARQQKRASTKQGLDILKRQINIYNTFNTLPIKQIVTDIYDNEGNAAGTRFEIWIPVSFKYDFANNN